MSSDFRLLIFIISLLCHLNGKFPSSFGAPIRRKCVCFDWYGRCKGEKAEWLDDDTWNYRCDKSGAQFIGCTNDEKILIPADKNITIKRFWFSCQQDAEKLRYDQEPRCVLNETKLHVGDKFRDGRFEKICLISGIWVTGCHVEDVELGTKLLKIGESTTAGLVVHKCDRISEHPGLVQYWTEIRRNSTVISPGQKGQNLHLPAEFDQRLNRTEIKKWTIENVALFLAKEGRFDTKIRFLD